MLEKYRECTKKFLEKLDAKDFDSSATLQSLEDLMPLLFELKSMNTNINSMVDLGCGYGGLTRLIADYLGVKHVYGIDLDDERLKIARSRNIITYKVNLEEDKLPFDDETIDLVTSFGVLEHLRFYDNPIKESYRILRKEGYVLFSIPNLGSWINRLALLLGYQPRDVEISNERAFGVLGLYPDKGFLNHIHSSTLKAFTEMLEYYGFRIVKIIGLHPYQELHSGIVNALVKILDKMFSIRPSLCRRIIVLAIKS